MRTVTGARTRGAGRKPHGKRRCVFSPLHYRKLEAPVSDYLYRVHQAGAVQHPKLTFSPLIVYQVHFMSFLTA
jgi:hypothetical protein